MTRGAYDTMGYVLLQEGRTEEALACYRQGIAVFDADPVANEACRSDCEKAMARVSEGGADASAIRGR